MPSPTEKCATTIHAAQALTPDGWRRDVRLRIAAGRIVDVSPDTLPLPNDDRHAIVLPAIANLHSHAFQRGMAGLAERRAAAAEDFWSWREVMYRFALALTPDHVEAIAAQLYVEMLEAGFSRVGEFHYLHHAPDGRPYADVGEMAGRIAAAAEVACIGLTLLPVFYAHSTFGGAAPTPGQCRFLCDLDTYAKLVDRCRAIVRGAPGANVGVAPHSLRAVTPEELSAVIEMSAGGPIHLHVAEQRREVDDCLVWSGARPIEWLIDHAAVDDRWCLIHATHTTPAETLRLAASGAIAGLCPITEANLGDGTFDAARFVEAGGRFGVGTDSNIQIGVAEELRQLEYAQRLHARARTILAPPGGSTGRALYDAALIGGAQALGVAPEDRGLMGLRAGAPADLVSLDAADPRLAGRSGDAILDAWIFGGGRPIDSVWVAGRRLVTDGRHPAREAIGERFRKVAEALSQIVF